MELYFKLFYIYYGSCIYKKEKLIFLFFTDKLCIGIINKDFFVPGQHTKKIKKKGLVC